jgi:hypothetical protein
MDEGKTISLREYIAKRDVFASTELYAVLRRHMRAGGAWTEEEIDRLARLTMRQAAEKWDRNLFPELVAAIDAVRLPVKG